MQSVTEFCDAALLILRRISHAAALIGATLMLLCAFLIVWDVLARRLFSISTWGADELSYYAMAVASSWSLAFALLARAHIRIDVVRNQLGLGARVLFDIAALCGMAFTAFMLSGATWDIFERSWQRGTTSITQLAVPLWIPQGLWFAGFGLLTLVCTALMIRVALALMVERSLPKVEEAIGVLTAEAETTEAISDVTR